MDNANYRRRLSERRLARRALLRSGGIAAAGLGMAALAGCGRGAASAGKATGGAGTSPSTGTSKPQTGGVLTARINTDPPTTWIPSGAVTFTAVWPFAPAYNQLVQRDPQDPDNKIIPDLADSYEIAGDGKSIVFRLHPGVKFHDGTDLTSEDVKLTLDWVKSPPAKKTSSQQGTVQVIDHVETPDPLTAKLVLSAPSPSLLGTLASHYLVMGAKADLAKDTLGTLLNGTGPFKLKSLTRGVGVELERNPNYFVKDRPYLDGVKHSIVVDENTAMTDLIAGRFQRYFTVLPDNYDRVEKETGGKCKAYSPRVPNRNTLYFNGTKKPFNDPRVRQAVSMALDRQAGVQIDLLGHGVVGGYMMPSGQWAISADQLNKVPGYGSPDIVEAKKLLAAAGVTEPLSGTLLTRSDASFQGMTTYVQGSLQKAFGWNFKHEVKDSASAFAAADATQFDLLTWIVGPTMDDPDAIFGTLLTSKAATNWSKIYDPEADALYEKQSQTLDAAQRRQLSQQLELKYLNNFPLLTLYFRDATQAIWDVVQNYKIASSLFTNQRYQDVWLNRA